MKKIAIILILLMALAVLVVGCGLVGQAGSIAKCTDSDGGNKPWIKGTCKDTIGSYTDFCNTTISNKTQVEYYCSNNQCIPTLTDCYGGCSDGACQDMPEMYTTYPRECIIECGGCAKHEACCKQCARGYPEQQH